MAKLDDLTRRLKDQGHWWLSYGCLATGTLLFLLAAWGPIGSLLEYRVAKKAAAEIRGMLVAYDSPKPGELPRNAPAVMVTSNLLPMDSRPPADGVFGVQAVEGSLMLRRTAFRMEDHTKTERTAPDRPSRVIHYLAWEKTDEDSRRFQPGMSEGDSCTSSRLAIPSARFWARMSFAGIPLQPELLDTLKVVERPLEMGFWNPDPNALLRMDRMICGYLSKGYVAFQSDADNPAVVVARNRDKVSENDVKVEFSQAAMPAPDEPYTVVAAIREGAFAPIDLSGTMSGRSLDSVFASDRFKWTIFRGAGNANMPLMAIRATPPWERIVVALVFKVFFGGGFVIAGFVLAALRRKFRELRREIEQAKAAAASQSPNGAAAAGIRTPVEWRKDGFGREDCDVYDGIDVEDASALGDGGEGDPSGSGHVSLDDGHGTSGRSLPGRRTDIGKALPPPRSRRRPGPWTVD